MTHFDYVRTGLAVPKLILADIAYNFKQHVKLIEQAMSEQVQLLCFPELSLTGYSCADLFHQQIFQESVIEHLAKFEEVSNKNHSLFFIVGIPFAYQGVLYPAAAVYGNGGLLAIVPKSFLPSYDEFKESVYFQSAPKKTTKIRIRMIPRAVIFGIHVIFECIQYPKLRIGIEICEDLWSVHPPSSNLALNGASIIFNLSASTEQITKGEERNVLIQSQSNRSKTIYCYVNAGIGETSMDVIFSGHSLIYELGKKLAELKSFDAENQILIQDVDIGKTENIRIRNNVWRESVHDCEQNYQKVMFSCSFLNFSKENLLRKINSHPLLPANFETAFQSLLQIQANALAMRLKRAHARKIIIGLSGGLDSSYGVLVCVEALQVLNWKKDAILPITMPSFGTSKQTQQNVQELCKVLSLNLVEINITDIVKSILVSIKHSGTEDLVFENAQARVRTQILFDYANKINGLVIGTSDLSELALGWMTYGGDHLSSYGLNSGVTKTEIRAIMKWLATKRSDLNKIISLIIATPISPELLPPVSGKISQKTETILGPFEVLDFYLYHMIKNQFPPKKILFLASRQFAYTDEQLKKWLKTFYRLFFKNQFKRNSSPDGIKTSSLSLSPRSQWRVPSDIVANQWLSDIEE